MNNAEAPKGRIDGTAVVRDKFGNIKGSITFGGEATKEQIDAVKAANPNIPSGEVRGSDTNHSGS